MREESIQQIQINSRIDEIRLHDNRDDYHPLYRSGHDDLTCDNAATHVIVQKHKQIDMEVDKSAEIEALRKTIAEKEKEFREEKEKLFAKCKGQDEQSTSSCLKDIFVNIAKLNVQHKKEQDKRYDDLLKLLDHDEWKVAFEEVFAQDAEAVAAILDKELRKINDAKPKTTETQRGPYISYDCCNVPTQMLTAAIKLELTRLPENSEAFEDMKNRVCGPYIHSELD